MPKTKKRKLHGVVLRNHEEKVARQLAGNHPAQHPSAPGTNSGLDAEADAGHAQALPDAVLGCGCSSHAHHCAHTDMHPHAGVPMCQQQQEQQPTLLQQMLAPQQQAISPLQEVDAPQLQVAMQHVLVPQQHEGVHATQPDLQSGLLSHVPHAGPSRATLRGQRRKRTAEMSPEQVMQATMQRAHEHVSQGMAVAHQQERHEDEARHQHQLAATRAQCEQDVAAVRAQCEQEIVAVKAKCQQEVVALNDQLRLRLRACSSSCKQHLTWFKPGSGRSGSSESVWPSVWLLAKQLIRQHTSRRGGHATAERVQAFRSPDSR